VFSHTENSRMYNNSFLYLKIECVKKKLEKCCSDAIVLGHDLEYSGSTCDYQMVVPVTCQYRICKKPSCVGMRERRYIKKYQPALKQMHNIKLLTLTFKGFDCLRTKKEHDRNVNNFIRRLKRHYGKFNYICVLEVNARDDDMYYFHYHILTDLRYIPQKKLSDMWYDVTKTSFVVDIRRCNPQLGLKYIVKYVVKGVNVSVPDYAIWLYRKRMIFTSLDITKLTEPKTHENHGLICPKCHEKLEYLETIEEYYGIP